MPGGFYIEETDTFGGEANYCWVNRHWIADRHNEPRVITTRRIKAAAGYSGVRGRSCWNDDSYEFRPAKACIVVFADWREENPYPAESEEINDEMRKLLPAIDR